MERRVVITGAGIVCPLGDSPAKLHESLCAGRVGLRPIELFSTDGLKCHLGGEIYSFSAKTYVGERNLRPLDRTSQLVISAAQLALDASGWSPEMRQSQEVGLVLGTMFCSVHTISEFDRRALVSGPTYASPMDFANTVINAAAGQTAIWHNLRGVNSTIAAGTASGLQAIAYATELIRNGRANALLAGGADELCFESFYGFNHAEFLCGSNHSPGDFSIPFDLRRNGFALGEGAALLMLEDAESALRRGARIQAEIKGHGSGFDPSRGADDQVSVKAIARAIRLALDDAGMAKEQIDCLSASANGSVRGDRHEAQAIAASLNGHAQKVPVTAIKSMLGETLGASGAMQAVALVESLRSGVLPGISQLQELDEDFPLPMTSANSREMNLSNGIINSMGLDGNCCSIILARCENGAGF
jgi:3-oxoacyl-[acyl-carrier-protein] synthase II